MITKKNHLREGEVGDLGLPLDSRLAFVGIYEFTWGCATARGERFSMQVKAKSEVDTDDWGEAPIDAASDVNPVMDETPSTAARRTAPEKILIVDDEEIFRQILGLNLELEGYEIHLAENGTRGYEMFTEVKPDLVISDVRMARGRGEEFMRRIASNEAVALPVVLCVTGYLDLSPDDAFRLGVDGFFLKPFSMTSFLATARQLLKLRSSLREILEEVREHRGGVASAGLASLLTPAQYRGSDDYRDFVRFIEEVTKESESVLSILSGVEARFASVFNFAEYLDTLSKQLGAGDEDLDSDQKISHIGFARKFAQRILGAALDGRGVVLDRTIFQKAALAGAIKWVRFQEVLDLIGAAAQSQSRETGIALELGDFESQLWIRSLPSRLKEAIVDLLYLCGRRLRNTGSAGLTLCCRDGSDNVRLEFVCRRGESGAAFVSEDPQESASQGFPTAGMADVDRHLLLRCLSIISAHEGLLVVGQTNEGDVTLTVRLPARRVVTDDRD